METSRILDSLKYSGMTELQFFAKEISEWQRSEKRKWQVKGQKYYEGEQEILKAKRTVIGEDGTPVVVENLPNNRVVDNQYAKMVDQKANYLLGKPMSVDCKSKNRADMVQRYLTPKFHRMMKRVAECALNSGVCWVCPYYDHQGSLQLKRIPGYQVLPFWADEEETILDCAVRVYPQEVWDNTGTKRVEERVEIYKPDGVYRYLLKSSRLETDPDILSYEPYFMEGEQAYSWGKVPLIPFRYNAEEIPLIQRVKSLQDAINRMESTFLNNMEEDPRNTILVITNYDGENLGEFRRNLAQLGAVKVRDDGGVTTLTIEVNAENYKAVLELLKKALIENARGYDAKDDRLSGNPNQLNIMSMYSDIDLDANGMETEFQAGMQEILWFWDATAGGQDLSGEPVTFIFDRDVLMNESETIENCQKSTGIISNETIVSQHPWVKDPKQELERLKKEKEESVKEVYGQAFSNTQTGEGDSGWNTNF